MNAFNLYGRYGEQYIADFYKHVEPGTGSVIGVQVPAPLRTDMQNAIRRVKFVPATS